jgi:hypothetical protein
VFDWEGDAEASPESSPPAAGAFSGKLDAGLPSENATTSQEAERGMTEQCEFGMAGDG